MTVGYAFCGSFCTLEKSFEQLEKIKSLGHEIIPIVNESVCSTDTRFGKAQDIYDRIVYISSRQPIHTVKDAEPLGPKIKLDIMLIAPCTGNTLAKMAHGISDTTVTMAAKAHLRSNRPLLIALASNDAMSANLSNIAALLNRKNVYFVPMKQDDTVNKPHSLVADFSYLESCMLDALDGKQSRPLFI